MKDNRLLVVIGPCSIHDPIAAYDYAERLHKISNLVSDKYLIIMRVYFEKPRTTTGWKGYINDPHLDDSCDMEYGLNEARKLLIKITKLGLPIATEFLDPIVPQYTADLISWAAIGARTTESQTHREMASGLSMPVGFKNGTDGNIQVAINAISSASIPHSFLGIDQDGKTSVVTTEGNPNTHLVLRGGENKPNFENNEVQEALKKLKELNVNPGLMIDCSHANANKISLNQINVWNSIINQRKNGNFSIIGAMIESFIESLPMKYETIIGENGFRLSGGEKQRLSIARAIAADPKILVLDEATSSLDSDAEFKVQVAIQNALSNRTAIVIAHRFSTLSKLSKIIVMNDGKVEAIGTSESLYKESSTFKQLYDLQFGRSES